MTSLSELYKFQRKKTIVTPNNMVILGILIMFINITCLWDPWGLGKNFSGQL